MNTPKIRFKGFTDAWEQRKLGEVASDMVAGGDIDKDLILTEGQYPVIANALTGDGIVGYYDKEYRVSAPAVTVTGRGDVGHAKARLVNFTPVVRLLSVKSAHDVFFLENAINTLKIVIESTGVPQLTVPQLAKYEVVFPPQLDEEEQIGNFFQQLDHLITLHQRKCDETKQLKKFMLQKMFPKNGEKNPEIRFEGFTDDWEQRKVGEVTKELLDYDNFSSGLPLLTSSRSGLMYQSEYRGNATTENENTLFSVVPLNACTYRHMSDDSTFHLNINTLEKGLVSKEYPVFQENESNLKFIVQYINSSNSFTKFCTEQKKGGTRTRLYYKTLCEYKLMMPSIKEQNKTANFFDTLDHLITLHQRKCEKLKELKKFMLQNMFV